LQHRNYLFPGYPIIQDDEYFKLSQDSVLLADFAGGKRGERILDLGCGIGVLMLLVMLKRPGTSAVGFELTPGAAELAMQNLELCGLTERGSVMTGDMKILPKELYGAFDICICNPPYFRLSQGPESPKAAMAAARSQGSADIDDVCAAACAAVKYGGRFCVCYPPEGMAALFAALNKYKLEPKKLRLVHPREDRPPCLVMVEAKKGGGPELRVMPPLIISRDGQKTEEYRKIYRLEEDKDER